MSDNNNNNQVDLPYTPTGDPSLWCEDVGQVGRIPPSLFNEHELEEGSIVGFEDYEGQQQEQQAQQEVSALPAQQQQQAQAPLPPLPLQQQPMTRENCFSVSNNEEKTTFFLSFNNKFNKEVQEYGPLSMSGCLTLEAKGKIKESLQEDIETALNHTLQDLGYRFKLCFGPVCADILSPEEAVVKEKVKSYVEKKSAQAEAAAATTKTKKKAAADKKKKKKTSTMAAPQKGENGHHPSSSPSSKPKRNPPPPPLPTAAATTPTTTTTPTGTEKEAQKVPMANGKRGDGHFHPPALPQACETAPPPPPTVQKPPVAHKTKRVTAAARSKQITSFQKEIDRTLGVSQVVGGGVEPHEKEEIEQFVKGRVDDPTEAKEIVQLIMDNEQRHAQGKKEAKEEEKEKSATPPVAKKPKANPPSATTTSSTDTNYKTVNWCKIGGKVYTRQKTEVLINRAIMHGFTYYANLLYEGLGEKEVTPQLVTHIKIAWVCLPDSKKKVVVDQALSNTYGREWTVDDKGHSKFEPWL